MRMNFKRSALAAALLIGGASSLAWAAGMWSTLPIIGGAAYCASSIGVGPTAGGITGQGAGVAGAGVTTGTTICGQTVPAGPPTFAGTEVAPFDLFAPGTATIAGGPATALVGIGALGNGAVVDNNIAGAAQTIPNNTSWFVLDTNTPTTVAVTFPAVATEGFIQHLVCGIAISVALSVVANTGQTVKNGSAATCTAGQGFAWRFVAGANGALVANTWLRIY